jgi:hypothetical protein
MGGATSVDGGEMAVTADHLGEAAPEVCDARDLVLAAWQGEWSVPAGELHDVFVDFCRTWLTGLDAVAQYVQFSADYTQAGVQDGPAAPASVVTQFDTHVAANIVTNSRQAGLLVSLSCSGSSSACCARSTDARPESPTTNRHIRLPRRNTPLYCCSF